MPRVYLTNLASDVAGYKLALVDMRNPSSTALVTSATTTTGSGDDIQCTDTAGGTALKWITKPFQAAVTLATKAFLNIWAYEATAAANCNVACNLYPYTTSEQAIFLDDDSIQTELTTSAAAQRYATVAVTSQAFAIGDRLVLKLFASNAGLTMGAVTGGLVVDYDGPTPGADGDTFIDILENFRVSETQFGSGATSYKQFGSEGRFTSMIDAMQFGVDAGYYGLNSTVRSAIDTCWFERGLLAPRYTPTTPV